MEASEITVGPLAIDPEVLKQVYAAPVLIVDDNAVNRIFLDGVLESRGFTKILTVASGLEALDALAEFKPDIIILDIMMPGMDGLSCCEAIRLQPAFRDVPIIMQTVLTEPELRARAFERGASDFVSKPLYPAELYRRVMVHLEKRLLLKNLQLYKSRIEQELHSARQLQQGILPTDNDIRDVQQRYHLDIASHFQPSSEISGDFWGMKRLSDHEIAIWMVDFSGHGVAAALNAFRLQAYLKEYSTLANRAGEYLSHMNDKLLYLTLREQFATMFYGVIDTHSNQLYYACAATPHPIILRQASGEAQLLDGSGFPLGIGMHVYNTHRTPFRVGDTLLLYSDALIETPDYAGGYISEEQLVQQMAAARGEGADAIKKRLLDYFYQHAQNLLTDDLTLAVCRRLPEA